MNLRVVVAGTSLRAGAEQYPGVPDTVKYGELH
jgi:hypothetical protein